MAPQIAELDVIAETVRHGCDGAYRSSRAKPQASFHAGATIAGIRA